MLKLVKFPFRVFLWVLRRLVQSFRKKSWLYIMVMLVFMSLDVIFPGLGGTLTTSAFVLGPAVLMGVAFTVLRRLDGTMPQFMALSSYMAVSAAYGLFRAWSKAADTSLPDAIGSVSRWTFGPLWNMGVGVVAVLFGKAQSVPMPVWGNMPFSQHLLAMDPLLTGLSLIVLLWSVRIFMFGTRRYAGETKRSERENGLAQNKMTPIRRANWTLHGRAGNLRRHLRGLLLAPRLPVSHMVIGFGPPPQRMPWLWPWLTVCWLIARLRPVEMTIFDTRRIITADARNGALILGGAGAGKTLIQQAYLAYSTSNKILIETQGNVFDKDVPLAKALNRKIAVITSDLGDATATVNVLATLDPEDTDFWDRVMWIASLVICERGEHGTLERCSRELVACVVGNVVFSARLVDEVARLDTVYDYLTDPELSDELLFWAENGHPAFRQLCQTLATRTADGEFLNSMAAIFSNELGFLAHPTKRAMVCGSGNNVLNPADMLEDPRLDVAIQIAQESIAVSGALLRLLLGALLAPRLKLTAEEAKRTRAPGVTVWIDELAAFAGPTPGSGAPMLDEIVVFGRQKQVRWVYAAQSIQQIERGWGEGTYGKWANSAVLRIFGKVGADPELDAHITDVAGKTLQEKFEKIPGQGGGWRSYQIVRDEVDLLPRERLSKIGENHMIAFVRKDDEGLLKLQLWRPAFFAHACLKARIAAAQARFGGKPRVEPSADYAEAIMHTRRRLEADIVAEAEPCANTNRPPPRDYLGPDLGTPAP